LLNGGQWSSNTSSSALGCSLSKEDYTYLASG